MDNTTLRARFRREVVWAGGWSRKAAQTVGETTAQARAGLARKHMRSTCAHLHERDDEERLIHSETLRKAEEPEEAKGAHEQRLDPEEPARDRELLATDDKLRQGIRLLVPVKDEPLRRRAVKEAP